MDEIYRECGMHTEMTNAYKHVAEVHEVTIPVARRRCGWEDNIKNVLK
jgi:hypothetical protein